MQSAPDFSIVIPARNEEALLPACLDSIERAAEQARISIEIIVVVNRSDDNTEQIATERGCRVTHNEQKNLSAIRNAGVAIAQAQTVVTVDADSLLHPKTFERINKAFENSKTLGGGTTIVPDRYSLGIIATGIVLAFIVFRYGISGGLFFFRKDAFDAIGGFDETLYSAEDVDFAIRLKRYAKANRAKFKTLWWTPLRTSTRKFDAFGDWYMIKNPALMFRMLKGRDIESANRFWYDFER